MESGLAVRCAVVALSIVSLAQPVAAAQTGDDQRLLAFVDQAYDEATALSPESLTSLGSKQDYDKLDDYTEAGARKAQALLDRQVKQLHREFDFKQLSDTSKLTYRLFEESVEHSRLRTRWITHFYQVSTASSPTGVIPAFLINNHRIDTVSDAQAYVARLADVERALGEIAARMRAQAAKGIMPPKFVYAPVASDTRKIITGAPFDQGPDSVLLADFKKKLAALQAPAADKSRLTDAATKALTGPFKRGYDTMLAAITEVGAKAKASDGVWSLPDGEAYYTDQLRYFTTTSMTPAEIHAVGLSEVARIRAEMEGIKRQVGFQGTLAEFFKHIKNGEQFHYPNTDAGKQAYLDDAKRHIADVMANAPKYFRRLPKAKLEVRAVEPWREATASTGFYSPPAPDGSRPGIYYANLADMRQVLKPQIEALTYHEGAPGHHFQLALAQELPDMPKFRRFSFSYGAYVEGWGLYSEKLGQEMGFYQDPYARFGRLSFEMMRAIRLVVDSGVHSKRWTREQSIAYFEENSLMSDRDIVKQVERYFGWPGQATGYKVGEMRILLLRESAQKALGSRFDLRDFHDVVLADGALPLSILQERVEAYVKKKQTE